MLDWSPAPNVGLLRTDESCQQGHPVHGLDGVRALSEQVVVVARLGRC